MLNVKFIEHFLETKLKQGMVFSVGTSITAFKVVRELALQNILYDLDIKFVPSTIALGEFAHKRDIKLASIDKGVDLLIEFADSVDVAFNYAKQETLSLIRDKVLAYSAKEVLVFVKEENILPKITSFPVEVARFGFKKTVAGLDVFGKATIRNNKNGFCKTMGQNYIVDLKVDGSVLYDELDFKLKSLPGVLETGLFLNFADKIYTINKKNIKKFSDLIERN